MNNYYKHSIKPLREIIPNDNNARTHSEKQLQQIMAAIQAFGFTNPLLVSVGGEIIAGHGRYEAAKRLGFDDVPCIIVDGLTRSQQRALMLADNRLALNAGWDNAMLSKELTALNFDGFDIEALGFTSAEIADLVVPISSGKDPDATPPTSKDPRTLKGDIYELGDHLLICGDSTTPESYGRLLLSDKADCVWTDPPYNVNYGDKATFLNRRGKGNRIQKKILNDHMGASAFRSFLGAAFAQIASNIKLGSPVYVAHSETERAAFTSEFVSAGFKLSGVIIWKKNTLVMGRSDYQWMHEPILYGWLDGAAHAWYGGRRRTTVQEIMSSTGMEPLDGGKRYLIMTADRAFTVDADAVAEEVETTIILEKKPNVSKDHPTMKPVALIERMLVNSARRGDIVLDPFGGSGSTLIAAERLGLRARLIELDPIYCDTIVKRWEDYTGKTANVRRAG